MGWWVVCGWGSSVVLSSVSLRTGTKALKGSQSYPRSFADFIAKSHVETMATPAQHVLLERLNEVVWEFAPTLTYTVPSTAARHVGN